MPELTKTVYNRQLIYFNPIYRIFLYNNLQCTVIYNVQNLANTNFELKIYGMKFVCFIIGKFLIDNFHFESFIKRW